MIETLRSLRWVDYYLHALVDPRKLVTLINRGEPKPLPLSLIVVAAVAIIDILSGSLLSPQTPFFYHKITYGWILFILITLMEIVIIAAFIDLTCQFLGYEGAIRTLIPLLCFSLLPQTLLLPLVYIFTVFRFAPLFFYAFFSIALFIWSALIVMIGLSEINKIPFSKSALIVIFPFILIGLFVFFVLVLLFTQLIGYISLT